MQNEEMDKKKRLYEEPVLRVIELAAEEVLSVGCKTGFSDTRGVAGNGCLSGICAARQGS